MLNSIGLENRGIDVFLAEQLPRMKSLRRPGSSTPRIFVNLGGESMHEFVELAERVDAAGIDAIELNLSCPNVQEGRLLFSTDPRMTEDAVRRVKSVTRLPVFAKLSPNVTRVVDIAKAAEQGGADGITAINTLIGMAIDWKKRKPVLGRSIGGLSGPAIKPVALRMVWEIARAVRVPVIGVGGIATATDVLEFLVAGASAVQIGTQSFVDPGVHVRVLAELESLVRHERTTVRGLVGSLRTEAEQVACRGAADLP
jgi:dihydroorotate dehydrogenase (NAD+) catalytic subunit